MERVLSRREILRAEVSAHGTAYIKMRGNDEGYQDTLCG